MRRALREFRIRGVATNIAFLERLVGDEAFRDGRVTTRFIDDNPALLSFPRPRDRASRLLRYIAEITVNGHPEVAGRPTPPAHAKTPRPPPLRPSRAVRTGGPKARLDAEGPEAVAEWMRGEKRVLVTDTTMRDAHQSLLATRMRTHDIRRIAEAYAHHLPDLFSLECWGGATFDVAMRFLGESPWERLHELRTRIPNLLLQMLVRASNAVGYTNYPDNVVRSFIARAAESGIGLSHLRSAQLGREHAGLHRRRPRERPDLRGGPSATRRTFTIPSAPVTTSTTTWRWPASFATRAPTSSGSRTWRGC